MELLYIILRVATLAGICGIKLPYGTKLCPNDGADISSIYDDKEKSPESI